jgi:hypothetical protein
LKLLQAVSILYILSVWSTYEILSVQVCERGALWQQLTNCNIVIQGGVEMKVLKVMLLLLFTFDHLQDITGHGISVLVHLSLQLDYHHLGLLICCFL